MAGAPRAAAAAGRLRVAAPFAAASFADAFSAGFGRAATANCISASKASTCPAVAGGRPKGDEGKPRVLGLTAPGLSCIASSGSTAGDTDARVDPVGESTRCSRSCKGASRLGCWRRPAGSCCSSIGSCATWLALPMGSCRRPAADCCWRRGSWATSLTDLHSFERPRRSPPRSRMLACGCCPGDIC